MGLYGDRAKGGRGLEVWKRKRRFSLSPPCRLFTLLNDARPRPISLADESITYGRRAFHSGT